MSMKKKRKTRFTRYYYVYGCDCWNCGRLGACEKYDVGVVDCENFSPPITLKDFCLVVNRSARTVQRSVSYHNRRFKRFCKYHDVKILIKGGIFFWESQSDKARALEIAKARYLKELAGAKTNIADN